MDRAPAAAPELGDDWVALTADAAPGGGRVGLGGPRRLRRHRHLHRHRARPRPGSARGAPPRVRGLRGARRRPDAGAARGGSASAGPPSGGSRCSTAPAWWSWGTRPWWWPSRRPTGRRPSRRPASPSTSSSAPCRSGSGRPGPAARAGASRPSTSPRSRVDRMSAIVFLLIVVVVCAIGGIVLWLQHREPNTLESGLDSFRREMDALAPPGDDPEPKLRRAEAPHPARTARGGRRRSLTRGPRPRHRPRHRQHPRLRARAGHRAQRAHRDRAQRAHPRGAGHGPRGVADDRPHARLHRGRATRCARAPSPTSRSPSG